MLILTRKPGETVRIETVDGSACVLTIRKVCGERVYLAFEAPRATRIVRGELPAEAFAANPKEPTPCDNAAL